MQFPEKNVFCMAGFSDKVFTTMKLLETDKAALVNQIKKIEF
jgi:60 kDa SS-A/Ro ribonucleoprotein